MRSSPGNPVGIVYLERQTKGRRGKPIILIRGLPLNRLDLEETARKFKTKCGGWWWWWSVVVVGGGGWC